MRVTLLVHLVHAMSVSQVIGSGFAYAVSTGLFGSSISLPGECVQFGQFAGKPALASLEGTIHAASIDEAVRDIKLFVLLVEELDYAGELLRAISAEYEDNTGMNRAARQASAGVSATKDSFVLNEDLRRKLDVASQILSGARSSHFEGASDQVEAEKAYLTIEPLKNTIASWTQRNFVPVLAETGLAGLQGWEQYKTVKSLRIIWSELWPVLLTAENPAACRSRVPPKSSALRGPVQASAYEPLSTGKTLVDAKTSVAGKSSMTGNVPQAGNVFRGTKGSSASDSSGPSPPQTDFISMREALDFFGAVSRRFLGATVRLGVCEAKPHDFFFSLVVSKDGFERGRIYVNARPHGEKQGSGTIVGSVKGKARGAAYVNVIVISAQSPLDPAWAANRASTRILKERKFGSETPQTEDGAFEQAGVSLTREEVALLGMMDSTTIHRNSFMDLANRLGGIMQRFLTESEPLVVSAHSSLAEFPLRSQTFAGAFFELLARDWLDFALDGDLPTFDSYTPSASVKKLYDDLGVNEAILSSRAMGGHTSSALTFSSSNVLFHIRMAGEMCAAHAGRMSVNVNEVLGETPELQCLTRGPHQDPLNYVDNWWFVEQGLDQHVQGLAMAAMVNRFGDYRKKVKTIRRDYARAASNMGQLASQFDPRELGLVDLLDTQHPVDEGLSAFFAGKGGEATVDERIFGIHPDLYGRLQMFESAEQAIDYDPLREEIILSWGH